jgi:thiosulfate reductase cytochrome b subunit
MTETPADGSSLADAPATIRIVRKHALAIRWMHWINFPVLCTMIWSGLYIYYMDSDRGPDGPIHQGQTFRIGLGSLTLVRLFPEWFWKLLDASEPRMPRALGYHFLFMWFFVLNGAAYVLYTLLSGEWRALLPNRDSLREALGVVAFDLTLSKVRPPQGKYNAAQRISYTLIILMGLGSALTGLAMYKSSQLHGLASLFGGYQGARWLHFWLTIGYVLFFMVHVAQVIKAGWNNFSAMISGYAIEPAPAAAQTTNPKEETP